MKEAFPLRLVLQQTQQPMKQVRNAMRRRRRAAEDAAIAMMSSLLRPGREVGAEGRES